MRRLLFIRTDRMGDLLMSLPAIHAVRESFPEARISLLIQKELEPLLEKHPDVDQIFSWDPGEGQGWVSTFRWGRRLRPERFDAAIVLNPTRFFHTAIFLAGIPIRVGYRRKSGFLLNRSIPDTKATRPLHETQYNLELVQLLGAKTASPIMELPDRQEARQQAHELLASHQISASSHPIAIHPWTSNPAKSWPLDSFQQVADRLQAAGRSILIIGGPESRPLMETWKISGASIADLVGQTPLQILPAVLRQCALLISNDSGPVHVAAAVGTPTIVVAPKEHGKTLNRWRPLGPGHRILLSSTVEDVVHSVQEQLA